MNPFIESIVSHKKIYVVNDEQYIILNSTKQWLSENFVTFMKHIEDIPVM